VNKIKLNIDNEFKNLIPPLTQEEYKQLEENLIKEGCRDSLVVWNGTILDGHNRYEICNKHNIKFEVKEMKFETREDVIEWIIRNQFGRRNLPNYERAKLALRLKPIVQAKAKENYKENVGRPKSFQIFGTINKVSTNKELGKIAGISDETIRKVEIIEKEGSEEVQAQARKGEISINKAFNLTRKPETAKTNEEPETRTCIMCSKEKPISEFYGRDNECKKCKNSRNVLKISRKEARELNEMYPDELLNEIYEDMKNPTPKALEVGNKKHICNSIVTEYEELLNSFNRNIKKFAYMPQVKESETSKLLTDETIDILKKIIN